MSDPVDAELRTLWQASVDAATSADFRYKNGDLNEDAYLRYQQAAIAQARAEVAEALSMSDTTDQSANLGTAYLVLMDDGQVFSGHLDLEMATTKAEAIGGVVVAAPIVADYRHRIKRV